MSIFWRLIEYHKGNIFSKLERDLCRNQVKKEICSRDHSIRQMSRTFPCKFTHLIPFRAITGLQIVDSNRWTIYLLPDTVDLNSFEQLFGNQRNCHRYNSQDLVTWTLTKSVWILLLLYDSRWKDLTILKNAKIKGRCSSARDYQVSDSNFDYWIVNKWNF